MLSSDSRVNAHEVGNSHESRAKDGDSNESRVSDDKSDSPKIKDDESDCPRVHIEEAAYGADLTEDLEYSQTFNYVSSPVTSPAAVFAS